MTTVPESTTVPSNDLRIFFGLIALLSASLSCLLYFASAPWHFSLDDAYIVIDNANTLLSGGIDDSYGQNALVGTTSAVHLVSVAFLGLFMELEAAAFFAVAVFAAFYHVGVARLSVQIYPSKLVAMSAVCLSILAYNSLRQLYGGLETGLAMTAVVWCLSLFLSHSRVALPLLCGVMPFIRPELAALALAILAWRWYHDGFKGDFIVRDTALFLIGAVPWLVWYYLATGHFSSQTGSAKIVFFAEADLPWRVKLLLVGDIALRSGIVPLLFSILIVVKTRFSVPALGFVCAFIGAYVMFLPTGLAHNHSRYLYLLIPIGLAGFTALHRQFNINNPRAIMVIFAGFLLTMPPQITDFKTDVSESAAGDREVVDRAKALLPADARVLIHDAGYFAWRTTFETFDLVGLKTPSSISAHEEYTLPSFGRDRSVALDKIAHQNQITHFIGLNIPFWGDMARGLEKEGWVLDVLHAPDGAGFVIYETSKPVP